MRQGGVLSPILFTIYIDDLLNALDDNGVGCYWKHHFVGAGCYADDVALLAPAPSALRIMFNTCIKFSDLHCLSFNAEKTQLIKFYKSPYPVSASPNIAFLGKKLTLSNSIKHLGHILTFNLCDDEDIRNIANDMCCKANYLLHIFSCCDPFVKTRLLSSYCLSLYGVPLNLNRLKCLSTIFSERYGLFHDIAILALSILWLGSKASIML